MLSSSCAIFFSPGPQREYTLPGSAATKPSRSCPCGCCQTSKKPPVPTERCFFSSVTRRYEAENWGLADPVSPHGTKLQDSPNEVKTMTKLFRDGGVPRSLSITQGSQAATPDTSATCPAPRSSSIRTFWRQGPTEGCWIPQLGE